MDSTNTVWVAFTTHPSPSPNSEIQVIAVPPGGLPGQPQPLRAPLNRNINPLVMVDNRDNVWVFWCEAGNGGIWYRRFLRATGAWETAEGTQVPGTSEMQVFPTAVGDAEGGSWLFWVRSMPNAQNIWYARHNPVTQIWGEPRQVTRHLGIEAEPFVLRGPDGSFWLLLAPQRRSSCSRVFPTVVSEAFSLDLAVVQNRIGTDRRTNPGEGLLNGMPEPSPEAPQAPGVWACWHRAHTAAPPASGIEIDPCLPK